MTESSQVINTYDSNEADIIVSKQVTYFVFGQNEEVTIGIYRTLPRSKRGVSLSVLLIIQKSI